MISIKLTTPRNITSLTQLPIAIQNNLFKGMQDAALLIERTSKTKYLTGPYPKRLAPDSGFLRQRVWTRVRRAAVGATAVAMGEFGRIDLISSAWYGRIHERPGPDGKPLTTPFVISAKTPKGMAFFWKRRNRWVRGIKKVRIPARPFLYPALMESLDDVKALLNRMILSAYKQVGGRGRP